MMRSGPWVGCRFKKGLNFLEGCMSSRSKSCWPLPTYPVILSLSLVSIHMVSVSVTSITHSMAVPSRYDHLLAAR